MKEKNDFFYFIFINLNILYTNYRLDELNIEEDLDKIKSSLDTMKINDNYFLFNKNTSSDKVWFIYKIDINTIYLVFININICENHIIKIIYKLHDQLIKFLNNNLKDDSVIKELLNQEVWDQLSIIKSGESDLVFNKTNFFNDNDNNGNYFKFFKSKCFLISIFLIINLIVTIFILYYFNN